MWDEERGRERRKPPGEETFGGGLDEGNVWGAGGGEEGSGAGVSGKSGEGGDGGGNGDGVGKGNGEGGDKT